MNCLPANVADSERFMVRVAYAKFRRDDYRRLKPTVNKVSSLPDFAYATI